MTKKIGRKRRPTKTEARLLRDVNSTTLSASELMTFIEECQRQRDADSNPFEIQMFTAARLAANNPIRACSLQFRAQAVSRLLVQGEGAPGWTIKSGTDDSIFAAHAVFAAAAVEPMVMGDDGEFAFDRKRFLARVLEMSEPEVTHQ